MVQMGDPEGTGKGGTSIWGRKFEDEFHETLKVCEMGPRKDAIMGSHRSTSIVLMASYQWPIPVPTRMVLSSSLPMPGSPTWI